ncbi:MAG: helix-turn-helix transcriptional regulator [Burkholderiales bacterium]
MRFTAQHYAGSEKGAEVDQQDLSSIGIHLDGRGSLSRDGFALAQIFNELAHGVVLAAGDGRVISANAAAIEEFRKQKALLLRDGVLCGPDSRQAAKLSQALRSAREGKRTLITLGNREPERLIVLAIPVPRNSAARTVDCVALFLSRGSVCENLMLASFACAHRLTYMEVEVLTMLCQDLTGPQIASRLHIQVSTVRTHIRSLCCKTRSSSVRALVSTIAMLPPLRGRAAVDTLQ